MNFVAHVILVTVATVNLRPPPTLAVSKRSKIRVETTPNSPSKAGASSSPSLSLVCVCVCTMAAEVVITDGSENMLPSIVDFYSARDVFITGATGFMGKCLLEKLLRSVPDLGSVFVLTRAKKGKGPEQRTKELLSSPVKEKWSAALKSRVARPL